MDKPKPDMLHKNVVNDDNHNIPSLHKKQNIFAMASSSAFALKQEIANRAATLANMGINLKTREMRCVSKYTPHQGKREIARRLRKLQALGKTSTF